MEKFTAKEFVEAFISNQFDKEDWYKDYPKGMSVNDILNNDTVDVYRDDDHPEGVIVNCQEKMLITDPENMDAAYEI